MPPIKDFGRQRWLRDGPCVRARARTVFREWILDGLNTDGSPKDCSSLQVSCHAVFGKLIEGMDVLGAIHVRDPGLATTDGDVIQTIRIIEE